MYPYPTTQESISAIGNVVDIVRKGEIESRKAELANNVWTALGKGTELAFGNPLSFDQTPADLVKLGDEAACNQLEFYLEGLKAHEEGRVTVTYIPPELLSWLVGLLRRLLGI